MEQTWALNIEHSPGTFTSEDARNHLTPELLMTPALAIDAPNFLSLRQPALARRVYSELQCDPVTLNVSPDQTAPSIN